MNLVDQHIGGDDAANALQQPDTAVCLERSEPFLIASGGVGYLIESARQNVDIAGVYAGIAIATALVVAATAMVPPIERRALRWKPTERLTVSVS